MSLVSKVLGFDIRSLKFSILVHLSDGLSILFLDSHNLLLAVLNLVEFLLHAGLVLLLLGLHFLLMLTTLHVHLILEDFASLVFTCLELLEKRSVLKHL